MINRNQTISVTTIENIISSFPNLESQQHQLFKNCLTSAVIRTNLIRENIIEEGMNFRKGILVLEGTLVIAKKVAHGRIVFTQLNLFQIANIEIFLYERAYYTVSVYSSQAKYIQLPEELLKILFEKLKPIIIEKQNKRNTQIDNKIKEVMNRQRMSQKEKMINKLSLPAIKYFSRELKHSNSEVSARRKQETSPNIQAQPLYDSKKPVIRSLSRELTKNNANIELKPIQTFRHQDKKAISTDLNANRNEKLFKEHLKAIIKRKLVYERKELGVIKAYRNQNVSNNIIYRDEGNYLPPRGSQIDQYFKI